MEFGSFVGIDPESAGYRHVRECEAAMITGILAGWFVGSVAFGLYIARAIAIRDSRR